MRLYAIRTYSYYLCIADFIKFIEVVSKSAHFFSANKRIIFWVEEYNYWVRSKV